MIPLTKAELKRFFDRYLKGENNGWEETPKVRISIPDPGIRTRLTVLSRLFLHPVMSISSFISLGVLTVNFTVRETVSRFTRLRGCHLLLPIDHEAELIGYSKLHLYVEADGRMTWT